jgi:hypothetical protein
MRFALVLAALIATPASAQAPSLRSGMWHCAFSEQWRCDSGGACVAMDRNVRTFLDPLGGRYITCSNPGEDCITQSARFTTQGTQLLAQVDDGTVVKLAQDHEATGISTVGPIVFFERGRCTPGPAPTGRFFPLPSN